MLSVFEEALLLSGIVCIAAWRLRWLTPGGAGVAFLSGLLVWTSGRWATSLPLIFFFVSGSFFSSLPNHPSGKSATKPQRTASQVIANAGLALVVLAIGFGNKDWLPVYFISLSVANADTWSSELGSRFGGQAFDLVSGKRVLPGLSGGISFWGTLAGFVGAVAMALLAYLLVDIPFYSAIWVVGFGFLGMVIDSLLGSLIQRKYRAEGGRWSDQPFQDEIPARGWAWVSNSWVNFLANFITLLLFVLFRTF